MKADPKKRKAPERRLAKGGTKSFLINAIVLYGAVLLIALRMPSWGVAQAVVLIILALLASFQLVLYIRLK